MGESPERQYAIGVLCIVLPTMFVALRISARRKTKSTLSWDDFMIVVALVFCLVTATLLIFETAKGGLGRHMERDAYGNVIMNLEEFSAHQKALFGNMMAQVLSIGPTKISVLLFYRRLFAKNGTKWFDISSMVLLTIAIGWTISFFFANLFECGTEMEKLWDISGGHRHRPSHCIEQLKMFLAQAYADAATDGLIIILPIPIIWKLSWDLKKKIGLSCVFLLGSLTLVSSIARTVVQYGVAEKHAHNDPDVLYYQAPIVYWPAAEAAIGIIAACLPLLLPLTRGFSIKRVQQSFKRTISRGLLRSRSRESDEQSESSLEKAENSSTPVTPQSRDESGWLRAYDNSAMNTTVNSSGTRP